VQRLFGLNINALLSDEVSATGPLKIDWHEKNVMKINFHNRYKVNYDVFKGLFKATRDGNDYFIGDLAKQDDGSFRGTVTGSTKATQYGGAAIGNIVCRNSWDATQQLDVVAKPTGDSYFFQFFAVERPTGTLNAAGTKCPNEKVKYNGFDYAPFNDYNLVRPESGGGQLVEHVSPPPHGQTSNHIEFGGDNVLAGYWQYDILFDFQTP
jgi:hypothetical protein